MSTPHGPGDRPTTAEEPDEPRTVTGPSEPDLSPSDLTPSDLSEPFATEPEATAPGSAALDPTDPVASAPDPGALEPAEGDADESGPASVAVPLPAASSPLPSAHELLASSDGLPGVDAPVAPVAPVATEGAEPDTAPGPAPGGGGGDATVRRSRLPLVAAVLVVALLAAGVGYLGVRLREGARTETARSEAVAASRDAARLLFSYDHKTLQDDFARGLAVTTGSFREEYARTTKDVVSEVATEYKAVVLAEVVESAVIEASPSKVTTLVFLNQATTSTRVQGQQVDGSRVRMVLEERDGRWLVSAVEAL